MTKRTVDLTYIVFSVSCIALQIYGGEIHHPTYGGHVEDVINIFVKQMQQSSPRLKV